MPRARKPPAPVRIEFMPNCGRCGEEHEDLEFMQLTIPIHVVEAFYLTHWCPCPTNGEPIVMRLEIAEKPRRTPEAGNAVVAEA